MKKQIILGALLLSSVLMASDSTPFNESSRELELLTLELSEKRGLTPKQLLSEYHKRKTPTMVAIRQMKKEYIEDIKKVAILIEDSKKTLTFKLDDELIQEKIQYMHRIESFKLFKEEYKHNIYAQDELASLKDKTIKLEIKHAEYVINHESYKESLKNKYHIPTSAIIDNKTKAFFKANVEILKLLEEEYNTILTVEEENINEYLNAIKLAKEKIILKNHNLIKRLLSKKTLDLI